MKRLSIWVLFLMLIASFSEATALKNDGWNLMSVCSDMNRSEIDMTGIDQIQSQDGQFIFTGDFADWSDLETLKAGYGYWVSGSVGTEFDGGQAKGLVQVPLLNTGWNLMAMCEDKETSELDLESLGIEQIQSQDGLFLFTGDFADWSDLMLLESGYGYWVSGAEGLIFTAKDGVSLPKGYDYQVINNQGVYQEVVVDGFTVKLFANYEETANAQLNHKGVKAQINGGALSSLMQVQISYGGHQIVAGVYDSADELVAVSDLVDVTSTLEGLLIPITVDEVSVPNTPPQISGTPSTTVEVGQSYSFTPNATDADGDTLTFAINTLPSWLEFNTTSGELYGTPTSGDIGTTAQMTISVSDGQATASLSPFAIQVTASASNQAPVAKIEYSEDEFNTTITVGTEGMLSTSDSYDPDGYITHCEWRDQAGTLLLEGTQPYECEIHHTFDTVGTYVYFFTVTDDQGATDTNKATITVVENNNVAPSVTVTGGDPTVTVGTTLSFDTIVEDPDQSSGFSYHWRVERDGGEFIAELDTQVFSYQFNEIGTFIVIATVTDDHGATGSDSVAVTVENACVMPQLPDGFEFAAINNLGVEVQSDINVEGVGYRVKLYSNQEVAANDQANHVGIVVTINGVSTPSMQIQSDYRGQELVAAIYNQNGELVAVSDIATVNHESSITVIEMSTDLSGGCGNSSNNVDIWFGSDVTGEEYDAAAASDPTALAGLTTYALGYSCNGIEAGKTTFTASSVMSQKGELNDTGSWNWIDDWSAMFTISGNELLVDENGDNIDDNAVKYIGSTTDPDEINSHIGHTIFSSGVVAYKAISKRLTMHLEFDQEDEDRYVKTHGNTDGVYYTSIASFIENQQGNRYFMGNDMEGIAFAEGSDLSAGSGTLVEVDNSGNIINANAGTWNFNDGPLDGDESYISTFRLEVRPSDIQKYQDRIYAEFSHATYGNVVIEGDYEKADTGYEMIWFNEAGLNQFVDFLNNQGLPLAGNCSGSSSSSSTTPAE